jgi:hypothetical protein
MSCAYSTGQNPNTKVGNKAFESVAKFKCLGTPLMNEKLCAWIYKELTSECIL